MNKPDFCDWWTPERIATENANWLQQEIWKFVAPYVVGIAKERGCGSAIEIGCGAGYLGREVCRQMPGLEYIGVDANADIIKLARENCPDQIFAVGNIRTFEAIQRDIVFSFAVLKHFPLSDWREILGRILRLGKCAVVDLSVRIGGQPGFDDGPDYNHIWVREDEVREEFRAAGLEMRQLFRLVVPHALGATELWYVAGIPASMNS